MMNTAEKLNAVIDYIENHLTEEIEQDKLAQIACCSFFDLGRLFSLIAEITLSDYIRKRRLTKAGTELKYDNAKVLATALKYGYESPVSFARAFQSFHGFNPGNASDSGNFLNVFPKLVFQVSAKTVMDKIRTERIMVDGKEYEASYFGEHDMSSWSEYATKREYWRLENVGDDFKNRFMLNQVLPYNNYPPIDIQIGQVFVVDYHKFDGTVERKYYIADGTVWQDMPSTSEFVPREMSPIRKDTLTVAGRKYKASYFGEQDMSSWSTYATKREYWRLENVGDEFEDCNRLGDVLPYNNYPPIRFQIGQVFVIDYHTVGGGVERKYYIADGTVWQNMPSTRQFIPD